MGLPMSPRQIGCTWAALPAWRLLPLQTEVALFRQSQMRFDQVVEPGLAEV